MAHLDQEAALKGFRYNLALINRLDELAAGGTIAPEDVNLLPAAARSITEPSQRRRLETWRRAFTGSIALLNEFEREVGSDAADVSPLDLRTILETSNRVLRALEIALGRAA